MAAILNVVLIVSAVLMVIAAVAGLLYWRMMSQPLYKPGMMRAGKNLRAPLTPPDQRDDPQLWAVEEDIQLYHFSAGTGQNVLIIHGGPGYPYLEPWTGLEPLTADYRFHYYDQRGCGQSTRPIDTLPDTNTYKNIQTLEQTLGVGAHLADVERIRQILGEEQLILVGHSFGAFLASLYAAEFPDHVRAMVLAAPADMLLMPPAHGGLFEEVQKRLPDDKQAEYATYLEEYFNFKDIFDKSEADLATFNGQFATYYQAAYDLPFEEQGDPGGWMVQAQYFSLGKRHDYRRALSAVGAPVLVLHGADDLQTEAVGQMYVDALPNARLEVIPGAKHFSFEERPEAFAATVRAFLDELK